MSATAGRIAMTAVPEETVRQLADVLGPDVEVSTRELERLALAVDASHYLAIPQAIARPKTAKQVASAMAIAVNAGWPLTLRGGGSSLSGQAMSRGLTMDVRRNFRNFEILDAGRKVRTQPGNTIVQINAALARYGRKLGPDPASSVACTIGGLVANNSSGMTCGTTANTYRTIDSMVIVLPSGTVVDTGDPHADELLRDKEPNLVATLEHLRDELRAPDLKKDIERRYAIKNTMGYGVNSFIDFDTPAKILEHLMVGSEGTLGFVAQATFNTVPVHKKNLTGFLLFTSLDSANEALPTLVDSGADVVELIDSESIVAMGQESAALLPDGFKVDKEAVLLVEYQGDSDEQLRELSKEGLAKFQDFDLYADAEMTQDPKRRQQMWVLRNGLYTKIARNRPKGTVALLEDVAVPVPKLAGVCTDLHELFGKHNYDGAVIFGHAKDGNIHFLVTESFADDKAMKRYELFTEDLVDLIIGEQGILKAEHGTGRIMAPFVKRQYGEDLYQVMVQIKNACDPKNVLNPGTIIPEDDMQHLRDIKRTEDVRPVIDDCVECGYCEAVCPSQHLTTTPRQRIVLQRAIGAAQAMGDEDLAETLRNQQGYDVVDTCAVDGMCQTSCPVNINTGNLVRELRSEQASTVEKKMWEGMAHSWNLVADGAAGLGMTVAKKLPNQVVRSGLGVARKIIGTDVVPQLSAELPGGGPRRRPVIQHQPDAIFMPACIGSMFASTHPTEKGVGPALMKLAARAGVRLSVPEGISGLCCGTPWKSKGMDDGQHAMGQRLVRVLGEASDNWRLPIICDNASCTEGLIVTLRNEGVENAQVVDAVPFVAEHIAPKLPRLHRVGCAVVHPTCASTQLGINDALITLSGLVADEVRIPDGWRCCGFAGDRGLLHEELTATATADEAKSVNSIDASLYLSCNRTCELGMTRATGHNYTHVLEELAARL